VQYMIGHGLDALLRLGAGRSVARRAWHDEPMLLSALYRWGDPASGAYPASVTNSRQQFQFVQDFDFFDHIATQPPEKVPPDTCQPVWLSLEVPADAVPGTYKGTVTIAADGVAPIAVPAEAEVIGWRVPDPQELQTLVQSEQSPYGVAKAYGVPLWSDQHFRLIDTSFRQLGRLGNDWLFVPVLANSELGNRDDMMIRWVRRRDGSLGFDYAILDRYLDLAAKHCGAPGVVNFVVMQGMRSAASPPVQPSVAVLDERTGETRPLALNGIAAHEKEKRWRAFATSLLAHMKSRGQEKAMFWGYPLEQEDDPDLKLLLERCTPNVFWAADPHELL